MADSRSNESRPPRKRSAGSRPGQGKPPRSGPKRGDGPRESGRGAGPKRDGGKPGNSDRNRDGGKPRGSGPKRDGGKPGSPDRKRVGGKPGGSAGKREGGKPRGSGPKRDTAGGSSRIRGPQRGGGQRPDPRDRRDDRFGDRGPRFEARERDTSNDLPWPEEIFELELEPDLLAELAAAGGPTATMAKHLLSVQVLAEADPEAAYQHASRIRDRLPRAALARQTACIAAYRAGHFREAIKEESAYRRLSGSTDLLPIAADCERGLQRPERSLALLSEFEKQMEPESRTELLIVAAGARQDLGDFDAARVLAQKAVRAAKSPMAMARSRYALGQQLLQSGDVEQARKWLQSAADIDEDSVWTDAAEVLESL